MKRAALAFGVVLLAAGAGAQDRGEVDPYTRGDREAMGAAGYVSFGPFAWGDDHTTLDIEELLGEVRLLWVETAHFRIGSSLPEVKLTNEDKKAIQAELERLRARLPGVKTKTRTLDPWLRLHLYAQRMEELYADLRGRLGVTDADEGPYLGMQDKFLVLILEKESSLGRYGRRWGAARDNVPLVLNFTRRGSLCFATAAEFNEGIFASDIALHCGVAWNVVQCLLSGYRGYRHVVPRWFSEGLAHWTVRRIDPRYGTFSAMRESIAEVAEQTDWAPKVRARVKFDAYPSARELLRWPHGEVRTFADNMMMWSRVDFLMSRGDERFATFMKRLKAPIPVEPGTVPDMQAVFARQEEALEAAWGLEPEAFDAAWAAWVLDEYPRD